MFEKISPRQWLIAGVLVAAALRLFAAVQLPLSGDEAYHWEWSRHLAGSYYDHPGMTAWLIAMSQAAWSSAEEAAVRLPALVCLLVSTAIAFGLARDMARARGGGAVACERAAVIAAALVFFAPLPAGLSVYMSTDPALMPFWLATVWAFHRAIELGRTTNWLACGVCLGLAASTKLISLQLLGALFVFMVGWREGRRWWRRPQPWLALVLFIAAAAPMLWWNATNDWMTFRFNFAIRQRAQETSIWHPLVFVAGQAAVLTPGFMILALSACLRRSSRARPAAAAVVLTTWLPLSFFLLVSLRREVGVHWPAAAWLGALVVFAVALGLREPWTQRRWVRLAWRSSWVLTAVVLSLAHAFTFAPMRVAELDLIGGQPRAVLRNLFGWREIGDVTGAVVAQMRHLRDAEHDSPGGVFVMSNQYGTAAALAFYTPTQPRVHLWSAPRNHGRNYGFWDDWAALRGQDAVYVSKKSLADWELPFLREYFATVGEVEEVPIERGGVERNTFFLVRCRGFDGRRPFAPPE